MLKRKIKLQAHYCIILLGSSCPPHPLSTPDPYSSLALHSLDASISQRISLLWQKSVQDFNTVWQETHAQMGLRGARDSTAISVGGRQESVETRKGEEGPSSLVCFIGLPHVMDWHPERDQFRKKKVVFLTALTVCMVKFLFLWANFIRKAGILPLCTNLVSYLIIILYFFSVPANTHKIWNPGITWNYILQQVTYCPRSLIEKQERQEAS